MLLVREIVYCLPGKVRPLVQKFLAMSKVMEQHGWGRMRVLTDVAGERYWTLVAELEVPSLEAFMALNQGSEATKEMDEIMTGYHDLVDHGRREIYNIEA